MNNYTPWGHTLTLIKSRCSDPVRRYCKKGIKCLITAEQLKELWFRDRADELTSPSIDRIDNDGHYTLENCRFIELKLNQSLGGILGARRRHGEKYGTGHISKPLRDGFKSHSKLNAKEVWLIKRILYKSSMFRKDIALMFRVTRQSIDFIARNKTWRDVLYP